MCSLLLLGALTPTKHVLWSPGGGAGAGAGAGASDAADTGNGDADGGGGAAWADSDDENVQVDIGAVNRLRKLRTEAEADADSATISGAEYQRRLRKQCVLTMCFHCPVAHTAHLLIILVCCCCCYFYPLPPQPHRFKSMHGTQRWADLSSEPQGAYTTVVPLPPSR